LDAVWNPGWEGKPGLVATGSDLYVGVSTYEAIGTLSGLVSPAPGPWYCVGASPNDEVLGCCVATPTFMSRLVHNDWGDKENFLAKVSTVTGAVDPVWNQTFGRRQGWVTALVLSGDDLYAAGFYGDWRFE